MALFAHFSSVVSVYRMVLSRWTPQTSLDMGQQTVSTCGHCISSVFCSNPLAWLVCLTFEFCWLGSPEGRPLFLWEWAPGKAAVGLELGVKGSELGEVDGAGVGWCGDEVGVDA